MSYEMLNIIVRIGAIIFLLVPSKVLISFRHGLLLHGCQITKTVVEVYVEGRRRRGRPRKRYIDNMKQWTQMTTPQCVPAAEDSSRW